MSELFDSIPSLSQSSRFIDEIVLLRQTRAENETLKQLNTLYKSQVSDLEVEVSELKAQLTAKDCELKSLKEKLHNSFKTINFFHILQTQHFLCLI